MYIALFTISKFISWILPTTYKLLGILGPVTPPFIQNYSELHVVSEGMGDRYFLKLVNASGQDLAST